MKKIRKEFEVWANKELAKIQNTLLLNDYRLSPTKPSNTDASLCMFRYPYKDIEIQYSEAIFTDWVNGKKAETREILMHEMFHVVTDKLYAKAGSRFVGNGELEDEREQLTDHLANIVLKLT